MNTADGNTVDAILDISLGAGVTILQSGGETYRTEETMIDIARSLGAEDASAFVTPTVVMLTCLDREERSHTRIQRITERTIHLGRIARVNALSRRLASRRGFGDPARAASGASPRDDAALLRRVGSLLGRIRNAPLHRPAFIVLATAISSFFFSLMFSGSLAEAAVAFCIGAVMRMVLYLITSLGLSGFIVTLSGGMVISLLSGLAVFSGLVPSSGNVSISVLMSLVPGLAIVNAIRDIIAGDLVAGSARLLEAFVIAAALSLGAAFGLMLFPSRQAETGALAFLRNPPLAFCLAFFATAAFAYFFNINRYDIFWASLIGAAGWLVFLLVRADGVRLIGGYMGGALCVGVLSELCAVVLRKPATVYIVPGIIPLVPGGGMYETMFNAVLGNGGLASAKGFLTLIAAGAIAVGIALASSFARLALRTRQSALARLRTRSAPCPRKGPK